MPCSLMKPHATWKNSLKLPLKAPELEPPYLRELHKNTEQNKIVIAMFNDILIGYGIVTSLNFIFVSLKMFTVNFHQPMHDTDYNS